MPFSYRTLATAWVVVPSYLLFDSSNLRVAIHHEIQHHRHHDTTWVILWEALGCLFLQNPIYKKWKDYVFELQEYACDEFLVGQRGIRPQEYAGCLIHVAEAALY